MYPNNFLRKLNGGGDVPPEQEWPMWKEEGDILILPDGYRWRIERTPTVGDLVKPGQLIKSSHETTGRVIMVNKYSICCCPHRRTSSTILCYDAWDEPEKTLKYHRELTEWTIVYVHPDIKPNKDGTFRETDYHWINELVAVGNRILHLFENNDEEVFLVDTPKRKQGKLPPMQIGFTWDE